MYLKEKRYWRREAHMIMMVWQFVYDLQIFTVQPACLPEIKLVKQLVSNAIYKITTLHI